MIIGRGAEAIISLENGHVTKERVSKSYRFPSLDFSLRKQRTRQEARLLQKASFTQVPRVLSVDEQRMQIILEHLNGPLLRDVLEIVDTAQRHHCLVSLGRIVATLHDAGIIHGDLTTSNVILVNSVPYLFDFGLGFTSTRLEDKAVDLSLFRHALENKHYMCATDAFSSFLEGYRFSSQASEVFTRLELVDRRGRYKRKTQNL